MKCNEKVATINFGINERILEDLDVISAVNVNYLQRQGKLFPLPLLFLFSFYLYTGLFSTAFSTLFVRHFQVHPFSVFFQKLLPFLPPIYNMVQV